jgi:hypothetical protein
MQKIIEVLKDYDNDRYIFLHYDKSKINEYADGIVGISFHQGITNTNFEEEILWEFSKPDIHLTEIWRRITLNYPNIDYYYLIHKSIELFCDSFIHQKLI